MCGLNAIFAYGPVSPQVIRDEIITTRDYMVSRGPDGAGDWISADQRVGLGHRLLAIIDTSDAGRQPMAYDEGRLQLVFNGEIYNYRELVSILSARGHVLRSRSDSEVLLAGWREWGEALVDHIQGMYAFVIWDADRQGMFLARDPFGIKPLYIADDGQTLRIASQVKALLAGGGVSADPDHAGHAGYWVWGSVPEPHTLYRSIRAFPAGHSRWIARGGASHTRCFADLRERLLIAEQESATWSLAEVEARFREGLEQSVQRHLLADVPVGLFLSGGIDSGALAMVAGSQIPGRMKSLTLGFDVFKGSLEDETQMAAAIAARAGLTHLTYSVGASEFRAARAQLLHDMDQPSLDGVNTWLVSRAAREQGLKVALSGLGGDELLGGYPSFKQIPRLASILRPFHGGRQSIGRGVRQVTAPWLPFLTSGKYAGLLEYGTSEAGAYLLRRASFMPWELPTELPPEVRKQGLAEMLVNYEEQTRLPSGLSARGRISALEMTCYMRNQLLRDADWAGMAHGLEIRVPLLDLGLLAVASRADKTMLARITQHPAADAPKLGFTVPVANWVRGTASAKDHSRGLQRWMGIVHASACPGAQLKSGLPLLALWAPEMAQPGGVQSYMWRLWEAMRAQPSSARALSLNDGTTDLKVCHGSHHELMQGASGSRLIFLLRAWASRRHLVTVGHLHQAPVAWLFFRLGLIHRYVVTLHGIEAWKRLSRWHRAALRDATAVVVSTRYTQDVCTQENDLAGDNFHIIPLCAEQQVVQADASFSLSGSFPILFVARLASSERYKGLETLMQALVDLHQQGIKPTLHVVGDGDDRAQLEIEAATVLPANQVIFHGRLTDAALQAAYSSAAVFAMPSAKEGFGIVFLEAMRHGVPCIGGDHGGTPDVIRHGEDGFLVRYDDVAALAGHLAYLMQHPTERKRLGDQARQRFERDFTFERFQQRWQRLWQAL